MTRRQFAALLAGVSTLTLLAACGSSGSNPPATSSVPDSAATVSPSVSDALTAAVPLSTPSGTGPTSESATQTGATPGTIIVTIGTTRFSASLADTETARAFADRLPLALDMRDVNDNEKAFELDDALPGVATNPGIITTGELMLYGNSTIVLFYESFDTPYAYSRIGQLDVPDGLAEALGTDDVTVTFVRP